MESRTADCIASRVAGAVATGKGFCSMIYQRRRCDSVTASKGKEYYEVSLKS